MVKLRAFFLITSVIFLAKSSFAQFQYHFSQEVVVLSENDSLFMPWAGGLNTAQYNEIDLNLDGIDDLMVFNRDNRKVLTFIREDDQYIYTPEFEHLFPKELEHWVLLRDYNCDGKQDLFTSSIFGMSLYENVSDGSKLSWDLVYETIFTEGSNGQTNLQLSTLDLPGITDVDGDGDLDIMVFNFISGGGVEYHQNMSVERTGTCGVDLVRTTRRYGDFEECTCEEYIFGAQTCTSGGRVQHSGGKSINSYPYSSQNKHDLVIGQEECTNCAYLANDGTAFSPIMTSVDFSFPNSTNPITLAFPALYNIDIDFDGRKDILATNNSFDVLSGGDYGKNNWFYHNEGSGYRLITKAFMQEEMIDIGIDAAPAFSDINDDGDEDLFIGSGNQGVGAKIAYFENLGDPLSPLLVKIDNDYLNFSSKGYERVLPQFIDLNSDNRKDLLVVYSELGGQKCRIFWHTGNPLVPFDSNNSRELILPTLESRDRPYFYYSGNKLALLIGREAGRLSKYINQATVENPTWELNSDSFLGVEDNFRARNLSVTIDDMNSDGKQDLISYDDSGILRIYSDYNNMATINEELIQDKETFIGYNSSFGSAVNITTTSLMGSNLPSISVGLKTGGLQLLNNVEGEPRQLELDIIISLFPNPVNGSSYLNLIANQDISFVIIDSMGKRLTKGISIKKGEVYKLDVTKLTSGLYMIQAKSNSGKKVASRFVNIR